MENNYQIIDMDSWERKLHCQIFRNSINPQYCVSLELNITHFLPTIKEKGYSFTMAFMYAVAKCASDIREFRYRFLDGNVVLYDKIGTSFTYLNPDTELFKFVNVPMQNTMKEYVELATKTAREQTVYFTGAPGNDVYVFSSMPWVSFTHISHTDSGKKDNAAPLFDWGKYFERDGKVILPFAVQVHHSFVDGVHIGKLVEHLQQYLDHIN